MFYVAKVVDRARGQSIYAVNAENAEQALDAIREKVCPMEGEDISVGLCPFPENKRILRLDHDPVAGFCEPYGLYSLPPKSPTATSVAG